MKKDKIACISALPKKSMDILTKKALRENKPPGQPNPKNMPTSEADLDAMAASDIIDMENIRQLLKEFIKITDLQVAIAFVDLQDKVWTGTGGQDICLKFHRINPESIRLCRESDIEGARDIPAGSFRVYKCKHNLWSAVTPMMLDGHHIGNFYIGQFLFDDEEPDYEIFRQQAGRFGFDTQEYLAALARTPRCSRKKIESAMSFLVVFAEIIGNLSYSNIELATALEERKRAEDALNFSQTQLSKGMQLACAGHWYYDVGSDTFTFNDNFYRVFRTTAEKVGGYEISSAEYARRFCHPEDAAVVANEIRAFLESTGGDYSRQLEHRIIYDDGEIGYIEVRFFIVRDLDGHPVRAYGVNQDITERKRAEQERLAHLHFFECMDQVNRAIQGANDTEQMMKDVLDVMLSIFDCDRAFLLYPCDPEAPSWHVPMERTRPEYPGVSSRKVGTPMVDPFKAVLRSSLASDGPVKFGPAPLAHTIPEYLAEQPYGIKSFMSMALYPKTDKPWLFGIQQCSYPRAWTPEEERLLRVIGRRLSDSLTSLQAFRNLRRGEAFLSRIVENIPNMILVKDVKTFRYVKFNKAGEQLLGYSREEVIGKNDHNLFLKEEADFITANDHEVLRGGVLVDIAEETIRDRNNNKRILHTKKIPINDDSGKPRYLLSISEDITELNKLTERFRIAQRMDAIGHLAGGIAHDFNNMLGVIIGHTEMSLRLKDLSDDLYINLQEILKAANRSADLTRQLLAFARKQTVTPKVLDLNETIEGMLKMLRRLIGENIDLAWLPARKVWPIKIDPSQIDQILANLCVNARDAISGIGKLTIETKNCVFDETYCADHEDCIPGEYVSLIVSDNGCGIEKENLHKLFEPFFTTKEKSKGTGLGLSTVYGITNQNQGFINVYSEPGHGSTFKVNLPRYSGTIVKTDRQKTKMFIGGQETILLAEDDLSLLNLTREILETLGYHVLTASTPGEIIRLARNTTEKINLLLTDVVMPEMNGRDLAKNIKIINPEIKCLFMSGYTDAIIVHHGMLDEDINFIQKPFTIQTLAGKLREVLDSQQVE